MYHSITFGDKNTWDDWHLVPASRPVFLPPDVKTNYIDLPGADGHADATESLTGRVLYKNRTGSIEFYVMNGYDNFLRRYYGNYMELPPEEDRVPPQSEFKFYWK